MSADDFPCISGGGAELSWGPQPNPILRGNCHADHTQRQGDSLPEPEGCYIIPRLDIKK